MHPFPRFPKHEKREAEDEEKDEALGIHELTERDRRRQDATVRSDRRGVRQAHCHARRRAGAAPPRRTPSSSGRSGNCAAAADSRTSGRPGPRSAGRSRSFQSYEQLAQAREHCRGAVHPVRRAYEHVDVADPCLLETKCFTNAALYAIAIHRGGCVPARDENAEARGSCDAALIVENIPSQAATRSAAKQPLELELSPEPAGGVQAEALPCRARSGYSASRRRPRARRLRSTLRPPRVRLRTRNPWRRARRVFEGW